MLPLVNLSIMLWRRLDAHAVRRLPPSRFGRGLAGCCLFHWLFTSVAAAGAPVTPLPNFDFTRSSGLDGWAAQHDLAPLTGDSRGLVARITGSDPYLAGPARDYPERTPLWLQIRLFSERGGEGQVFFFRDHPTEELSVRFAVAAGAWDEIRVPIPALGSSFRLRLDPPGDRGECVIARVGFEERIALIAPVWPPPAAVARTPNPFIVTAGDLRLLHERSGWGAFVVEAGGEPAAIGYQQPLLGYLDRQQVRWLSLSSTNRSGRVQRQGAGVRCEARWRDGDGATWSVRQEFQPASPQAIRVTTTWQVDRVRDVVYLPVLTLFPGVGTHGPHKNQGLCAGLEYLGDEPSSSEADVEGPESWRLVPTASKWTFPLMAVQAQRHYVGLLWEPQPDLAAIHDSPDRQYHSGGHVMGLLMPGSDGANREENSLLPYAPCRLQPGQPRQVQAIIVGGTGHSVVAAVQDYVRLRGLPPLPEHGYTADAYFSLAARGWLDSKVREEGLFRHAVWPGFGAQRASDAAVWMRWLAGRPGSSQRAGELERAVASALRDFPAAELNGRQIGHVTRPLPALVFGGVADNAQAARDHGRALLGRFEPDGGIRYQAAAGGVDYGRTHSSREASGLAAATVHALLESAVFAGDRDLWHASLDKLRALDRFHGGVPRGAQTWEVPLHTPDILASAHLVAAYTLGYEMTGESAFLAEARYWAWTGVPFVYLSAPVAGPVGLYGTIPVYGATSWRAPVWLGRPVQWCGLVYADALQQLQCSDPSGPWKHLARGIVAAGLQHTWPDSDADRGGLLPDFYLLKAQRRDGPAINPATLQVPAIPFFDQPPPYSRHVFRRHGVVAHAAGELRSAEERPDTLSLETVPWPSASSALFLNGVWSEPEVWLNGSRVTVAPPHEYRPATGHLVLMLQGPQRVELRFRHSAPP